MFEIVLSNFGLWFNFLIPLVVGLYLYLSKEHYALKEFFVQIVITFLVLFTSYLLFFSVTTNLSDTEQINGRIVEATFYEGYEYEYDCSYQVCTGSNENQTCVTIPQICEDWKEPEWIIYSSTGQAEYISKNQFRQYELLYGSTEIDLRHSDQTFSSEAKGEGDKWVSVPTDILPSSFKHTYTNYVVAASDNVINVKTTEAEINSALSDGSLKPYPFSYKDGLGIPKQHRVIDITGKVNLSKYTEMLDLSSVDLGSLKQANPIIYITEDDQSIKYVIESFWKGAKKNDVVLILGVEGDKIVWSDVIAWTNNTDFIVDCKNNFQGMNVSDYENVVLKFQNLIMTEYVRKPMKEFEYLKENITLDWKYQFGIFMFNLIASFFGFRFFLKNY